MPSTDTLIRYLDDSAQRWPDRIALEEPPAAAITYRELADLSAAVCDRLRQLGVEPGDRVGICLRKSIDAVATIFGVLRAGAAYVPVDAANPPSRNAYVFHDCAVRVVVVESRTAQALRDELEQRGASPRFVFLDGTGGGEPLRRALAAAAPGAGAAPAAGDSRSPAADDLAYILYTSGSTGRPKGVMLTHRNATSFVEWASAVLEPGVEDRFSSHAPLHFDLSILDLYVPIRHGARVVLIDADTGKDPIGLGRLIAERRISVWYSTPSVLALLAQYGRLERYDHGALRAVLFAGEVFPVKHLRQVQQFWPRPRYLNLYGPTETNVCTWYEVPGPVPPERTAPYPIGRTCSHLRTRVVDERGAVLGPGVEGELCVAGPAVMRGYWNLPENTARAFLTDETGERWYRTGDIVVEGSDGEYTFVGRRDRMVKRRGYRIELGEIEAALYGHPEIREAAVVATSDPEAGTRITAFLSFRDGREPSLIELKRFCAEALPLYMVPDAFVTRTELPRTSTDKVDYQRLLEAV